MKVKTFSHAKQDMGDKKQCGHPQHMRDAANPEVWEPSKREFSERFDNQYGKDQIAECKRYDPHIEDRMIVVPVPFTFEGVTNTAISYATRCL
jgi:hypothetical protein